MSQTISVGNLLLDIANFRIVKQDSQKQARDAIIAEQGISVIHYRFADIGSRYFSP